MSDENNVVKTDAVSVVNGVNDAVKSAIAVGQTTIKNDVVGILAGVELDRRRKLLVDGLKKFAELRKAADDANRPDVTNFGLDGAKVQMFSSAAQSKLTKAREALSKFTNTLNLALKPEGCDFSPLEKALKGGDKPEEKKAEGEPTE